MSATQDTAGYIRVQHLGLNAASIYLADLDREINRERGDRNKVACYVPPNGYIDVLLCERTLASFRQGDIRGFMDLGYVDAFVVRELNSSSTFEEVVYDALQQPIQTITWTDDTRSSKVEERLITFVNGQVTQEIKIQYDQLGVEVERSVFTFTYDGNGNVTEIREVLA